VLQKNGLTATDAAAGATVTGAEGQTLSEIGFDATGHCGAGSPRFDVFDQNGNDHFFGCVYGTHPPIAGAPGWERVRQTGADAFPPSRPMLQGAIRHRGKRYRLHVHVVPATSAELVSMRGFRDALRADQALRRGYVALKHDIVARGLTDPVDFTQAKRDFIAGVLQRLGLQSNDPADR
jgi:hypothetical protein